MERKSGINLFTYLPFELSLRICCYLDPRSLDSLSNVSRAARMLLEDEVAWKNAFLEAFGTVSDFTGLEPTWRREYSHRCALLRKYSRGRGRNLVFDGKIGNISSLYLDSLNSRLTIANKENGLASVADTSTGKVAKDLLFPASVRLTSGDVTAISITRSHIIYGFVNGMIAMNSLNRHGQRTEFKTYRSWHTGPVTAISSSTSPSGHDLGPNCVTAGSDGTVKLWATYRNRECLASFGLSDCGISGLSWDAPNNCFLALALDAQVFMVDHSNLEDIKKHSLSRPCGDNTGAWTSMVCDHSAGVAIVATESSIKGHLFTSESDNGFEIKNDLRGKIVLLSMDPNDPGHDQNLPRASGRLVVFANEHGDLGIINTRNLGLPTRYLHSEAGRATALSLNATVVAVGYNDGSVLLFDILSLQALRPLSSRIPKFERIAEEDPARTRVYCIELHAKHPSGIIATGGQIRSFDFDPRSDLPNGKRKGLSRKKHTGQGSNSVGKLAMQDEIRDDMRDLANRQRIFDKEQERLKKLAGNLALEMSEAELVSYGELLSLESMERGADRLPRPQEPRDELEEAIYRSLQDDTACRYNDDDDSATSAADRDTMSQAEFMTAEGDEDYALALALSESLT